MHAAPGNAGCSRCNAAALCFSMPLIHTSHACHDIMNAFHIQCICKILGLRDGLERLG